MPADNEKHSSIFACMAGCVCAPLSALIMRRRCARRGGARGADYRRLLQGHPYIRGLHAEGDIDERAARFIGRAEEHGGISLQVVENTGAAGDVILLHPLVLHVATPNTSKAPRFLLSGGVDLRSMWTGSPS